jgi:hypothetical protein
MSPKARGGFGALAALVVVGGVGAFLALGGGGEAQQADPPPDPGAEAEKLKRFQYGYDLGRERAGFSGLPMVQIFVDETVDQAALDACLESPEVQALMPSFTGIFINSEDEDSSPRRLRRKGEHQVIVRAVNGKILGILPGGYTCAELLEMLERIPRSMIIQPMKSPIYQRLLESPDPIDQLIAEDKAERARKYVDVLAELEGKDHPAVIAAEARLAGR